MAFMKQEVNYEKMQKIKDVLVVEKKMIEDNEDKEFNLEEKHYSSDEDCTAAGKHLGEFNLYTSTVLPLESKDIEVLDYIHLDDAEHAEEEPDCSDIKDLPPGSIVYDSLEGVVNREYLNLYQAEPVLKSTLKYVGSEKEFAQAVTTALKQNSSSWVAYNLASSYWRVKGDAEKAVECVRRAIYHSPPAFLDVALVGLANILHRSRYTINASVVLENALEISDLSVIHFSLGCMYATLGEYSLSSEHFVKSLVDQPDFKAAKERLHAVRCQNKLQHKLEAQHESLQRTLKELEAYQLKHKRYVEYYQAVEKMQLTQKEQIDLHFLLMQHNIIEGTFDQKLCKLRSDDDGGPVMFCNLPKPNLEESEEDDELIPNIVSGKRKRKLGERIHEDGQRVEVTRFAAGGASVFVNRPMSSIEMVDWKDTSWPTLQVCEHDCPQVLPWDQYPSSYINPESRDFSVTNQLSSYIGLKKGESSPQPWDDLNCELLEPLTQDTLLDTLPGIRDRHAGPMHKPDELLKKEILMHLNDGSIWPGDIAHRISKAIKKSLSEQDKQKNLWFLYNVAALYFRIMGDNLKAVECIRRSVSRVPSEHLDIPFVNAGNILYRLGRIDDAARLVGSSLKMNNDEPATYLAFGNVLQAQGNITGAVAYYEYGLYLKPDFKEIFYALYNVKCGVLINKKIKEKVLGKEFEIKLKKFNKEESGSVESQQLTQVFTTSTGSTSILKY